MRENVTLILLANHQPSSSAQEELLFWLKNNPYVVIQTVIINDSITMKRAKSKLKFVDLPCLMTKKDRSIFRYYGEAIKQEIKRLYQEWGRR
jgi:hypothetical protein